MGDPDFESNQRDAGAVLNEELRAALIKGVPPSAPAAMHFGDADSEHTAAREGAVVFDLSDRTQIEITGKDSSDFLHNFCTNDIKKLQPGEGCEAFITNVKGRVQGHVFVFAGPDMLWLDTVPGQEDAICDHLNRYIITEDVTLKPQTRRLADVVRFRSASRGVAGEVRCVDAGDFRRRQPAF